MPIHLLADVPELIRGVGELRHREWGRPPERTDVEWWIEMAERETGRTGVPVTFVATDDADDTDGNDTGSVTGSVIGSVIGAVGLGEFDIPERRDRSPWILGMVVDPAHRGAGLATALLDHVHIHATIAGYDEIWVATEDAAAFYERCGYETAEHLTTRPEPMTVLRRVMG